MRSRKAVDDNRGRLITKATADSIAFVSAIVELCATIDEASDRIASALDGVGGSIVNLQVPMTSRIGDELKDVSHSIRKLVAATEGA